MGFDNRVGQLAEAYDMEPRGNGYLVPIIAKTDFSFDGRTGGSIQEIPLAVGVDSSDWVSGALIVRIHSRGAWSGGTQDLRILVDNITLAPEEPDVIFGGSSVALVGPITGGSPLTAPALLLASFSAPIGPMLRVRLTYSTAGAAQTGANTIALGVDLIGRPA